MKFIKAFFNHDKIIIGLSGLSKREEKITIVIPDKYKSTFVQNVERNYLLI